ncbi:leucyl aminopeptidase [Acidicapsa dinghuensis]|uniref:Probable cytosol aminopeptidase n=1 Tax=Acidicapsa dinghuensis TaxID=2218256 RepID=A0ABW1ENA5_9BACT|nr:leucyl aminopeptidase [Acidicapsa dinghuensis]
MKTQLSTANLSGIETELLAVLTADTQTATQAAKGSDAKPELTLLTSDAAVKSAAAAALGSGEFKAGPNETILLHAPAGLAAKRLLLVGTGKLSKATAHSVRSAAGTAIRFSKPRTIRDVVFALPEAAELLPGPCARAATEGALLADYDPDTYRSDRKDQSVYNFILAAPASDKAAIEAGYNEGIIVAESQNFARELVNEPGNKLTPTILGQRAAAMAKSHGLKSEVYSTDKLHELKMGAFWSVSQGSEEPPALIVLTYEPEGYDAKTYSGPVLGLVGKGITFDTGGISIKPADKMELMKYDMAGSAAMLGAMAAIARIKPNVKVISVVCSAENMPDGKAQKPGDVQIAMPFKDGEPGKSIEIINTDAEGRLVLADGLTYARQLGCTHLIDAATLTGACVVALGPVNAGGFSNDDETFGKLQKALEISGEKIWRLPLGDEYYDQIKSDIADIKNTGGRWGGAITAAEFLHVFAADTPWIHLDIAGMAWYEDTKPFIAKGPSGFGVRSILEWVRSYEQ